MAQTLSRTTVAVVQARTAALTVLIIIGLTSGVLLDIVFGLMQSYRGLDWLLVPAVVPPIAAPILFWRLTRRAEKVAPVLLCFAAVLPLLFLQLFALFVVFRTTFL